MSAPANLPIYVRDICMMAFYWNLINENLKISCVDRMEPQNKFMVICKNTIKIKDKK